MSDSPSTTRIEVTDEETRIYFTDYRSLYRDTRDHNIFERVGKRMDNISQREREILKSLYATIDYEMNTVKVSTARISSTDSDSIRPSAENLAYCESEITEREPTDAEKSPYVDSFSDCPEPIYQITLPPLEAFKNPQSHAHFTTAFHNIKELEKTAKTVQQKIEYGKWLKLKTSYTGRKTNLPAEWNPNVDSVDSDEVKGAAKQKYFTAKELWEEIFGISYSEFFAARLFVLNRLEHKLEPRKLVALELVEESKNESYCQYCGCIDDADQFLVLENKIEKERRVCERCGDTWSEFAENEVTKAKDERAKRVGGQRFFHNEYKQ